MIERVSSLPLVSIIVPVFNGEQYLLESLDSIIAQTYQQTEVLVMDDASTDGTPEIIASYGDRIICCRQPNNRGIYANMNDGIAKARGEYIAFYHADDIYDPRIVEREVEFFQHYPEAGAIFTQSVFIDAKGREFGRFKVQPELRGGRPFDYRVIFNALLRYKNRLLVCPSNMVPTSVYHDVGVYRDKEFLNSSDLEMWLRIVRKYPIGILEEYLIQYRHGHNSSAKRYHHLRTDQERYFRIMDLYLKDGGQAIATPDALAAYDAHRAEDKLMRAINHYILNQRNESQVILSQIKLGKLLGSSRIQRWRLLILFFTMLFLTRIPKIKLIANIFYQRWHKG
ncbi:MAG: glycosyltransferase [Planctomycetes bacterium]|nr:glycosyltransferase [Planctomycetota bacterium]